MNNMIDIMLRQQVYVEAVKNEEAEQIGSVLEQIIAAMIGTFVPTGVERLSQLSRSRFNALLVKFIKRLDVLIKSARTVTLKRLYAFMKAEIGVSGFLFAKITGKPLRAPYDGSGSVKLWKEYKATVVPATGVSGVDMVKAYYASVKDQMVKVAKISYSSSEALSALTVALLGSSVEGFKNGLQRKLDNQFKTMSRTVMQDLINKVKHGISGLFYERYQWVSVIDNVTTAICRSRDGNTYEYGKGNPVPPAHYNCRSITVPVTQVNNNGVPTTFNEWMSTQDFQFQNYALGAREASRRRKDGLTQGDNSSFISKRKSSLTDYSNSKDKIIGE